MTQYCREVDDLSRATAWTFSKLKRARARRYFSARSSTPLHFREPEIFHLDRYSPSLLIPTAMHFFSLQYWHRFLLMRKMEHCWFLVQGLYWIFCWMLRLKKPCEGQSFSTQSSLSQPELLSSTLVALDSLLQFNTAIIVTDARTGTLLLWLINNARSASLVAPKNNVTRRHV